MSKTQITAWLPAGEKVLIHHVSPEANCLQINIGVTEISIHAVPLPHMLELVKGLEVHSYFHVSHNGKLPSGQRTKQDAIDFIEDLIVEQELQARVKAQMKKEKAKREMPAVTEDDDDTSAV